MSMPIIRDDICARCGQRLTPRGSSSWICYACGDAAPEGNRPRDIPEDEENYRYAAPRPASPAADWRGAVNEAVGDIAYGGPVTPAMVRAVIDRHLTPLAMGQPPGDAEVRRLLELDERATPSPWIFDYEDWRGRPVEFRPHITGDARNDEDGPTSTGVAIVEGNATSFNVTRANAELICLCRTLAPRLAAANQRLAEEVARYREALRKLADATADCGYDCSCTRSPRRDRRCPRQQVEIDFARKAARAALAGGEGK